MARRGENLIDGAVLYDVTKVHDGQVVRDTTHDREIMRNKEERDAVLLLQRFHQLQDLRADRSIEREDTGSSATISLGRSEIARATAMRCSWPPLNCSG